MTHQPAHRGMPSRARAGKGKTPVPLLVCEQFLFHLLTGPAGPLPHWDLSLPLDPVWGSSPGPLQAGLASGLSGNWTLPCPVPPRPMRPPHISGCSSAHSLHGCSSSPWSSGWGGGISLRLSLAAPLRPAPSPAGALAISCPQPMAQLGSGMGHHCGQEWGPLWEAHGALGLAPGQESSAKGWTGRSAALGSLNKTVLPTGPLLWTWPCRTHFPSLGLCFLI